MQIKPVTLPRCLRGRGGMKWPLWLIFSCRSKSTKSENRLLTVVPSGTLAARDAVCVVTAYVMYLPPSPATQPQSS